MSAVYEMIVQKTIVQIIYLYGINKYMIFIIVRSSLMFKQENLSMDTEREKYFIFLLKMCFFFLLSFLPYSFCKFTIITRTFYINWVIVWLKGNFICYN